jgi:hypothetical protein
LSLHTECLLLFENAAVLREILTWGRESSRQVQDLKNISKAAFLEGMKKLKERANKCIAQGGMYFEV